MTIHKLPTILAAFLALLLTACNEPAPTATAPAPAPINVAAEKAAIKAAIEGESAAFKAMDVEKMLSYHADPMTNIQTIFESDEIMSATMTHDQVRPRYEAFLATLPADGIGEFKRSAWNIHLSEDATMAWVTYKAVVTIRGQETKTEEIRTLEKKDGAWKLALTGTVGNPAG